VLIIADDQTKGRGRRGRSWHSRPGENLTFSLLLRPALPARDVAPLTLLAGAALAATLSQFRFMPKLKWPNDVLLDVTGGPRKVAGILTEMSSEGDRVRHIVVGIGINVNAAAFPDDLARATSLRLAVGTSLYSFYATHPALPLPAKLDKIFPHFIGNSMPVLLRGFLLGMIALASMDTPLASLTTSFVTDIYKPLVHSQGSEDYYLRLSRVCVGVFAVILAAIAIAAAALGVVVVLHSIRRRR